MALSGETTVDVRAMGTAMPRSLSVWRRIWVLALLFGLWNMLWGCGTRAGDPVWQSIAGSVRAVTDRAAPVVPVDVQQVRIRASVLQQDSRAPVLMVTLPRRNVVATMALRETNADMQTWFDASGITVTLHHGVIVATRGLGHDLMVLDAAPTLDALSGRAARGNYQVVSRVLASDGALLRRVAVCALRERSTVFVETCRAGHVYENQYPKTDRLPSQQWIGPELGYIIFERLQ
jgi:hypothetical protein